MDKHYEYLTRLYLRLKGYLVSNLIIHSEVPGNSSSELDILGYRMPFHAQKDRKVNIHDFLESSNERIEIIIADVKNCKNIDNVKFNEGLRKDSSSIKKLIEWIGCYEKVNEELVNKFELYLNLHKKKDWENYSHFDEDLPDGKFRFKFTFFCPSLPAWNGLGFKYIHGEEMNNFIWECLNNLNKIDTCSRVYSNKGWNELEEYVKFFKKSTKKTTLIEFEYRFKNH